MVSVIISHYNNVANLALILDALSKQSVSDFEVIVSEDGQDANTKSFLASQSYPFPLQHKTQEDIGFRKNRILNTSVQATKGTFLVFIDGDCIPHKHFVKAYQKVKESNKICYGRRVMLSEKITATLQKKMQFDGLPLFDLILRGATSCKEGIYTNIQLSTKERGLKGCNWGIKKELLLQINGFDEDYVHAGVGEDCDVEWRLEAIGLKKYSMKNKAIVYHLHHKRTYSQEGIEINFKIFRKRIEENQFVCTNGILKNLT
jgi:GT2 family glycosyltransferase